MKRILAITAVALMGSVALAQDFSAFEIPSNNDWAIGMVEIACNIKIDVQSSRGTITPSKGGVIYRAYNSKGRVIASAYATSTGIFAKKYCLGR